MAGLGEAVSEGLDLVEDRSQTWGDHGGQG
jgi:hypothetical protein